ncbi:arginine repressor [Dysgonomonas sp. 216]|uniref:arginine repressor n=1 Tax=Dysgonomonas sp. 216 TaxID=2302934 RepID=UPI0013D7FF3D|nr:arginine repressor [Dysgonomonas sp. 216]NDW19238.1 arginine repressor [Dysgonomonas sp. 216]
MVKKNRQKAIMEIIQTHKIECQEDLLVVLQKKGFDLTQATLSRDLKELRVVKVPTDLGHYIYQLSDTTPANNQSDTRGLATLKLLGIKFSGNLAVVKTPPGYAQGIAAEIDSSIKSEIIGTVAGDDTILLVIREGVAREQVLKVLSGFML